MPLTKPDAILFDWDGTLVDTIQCLTTAYNEVFRHFDMPEWDIETAKHKIRTSSRETFPQLFGGRATEAFKIYYASIEENHLLQLGKMEGADAFLKELAMHNISLGLISNKKEHYLKREVAYLGWDQYFKTVIGAGRAAHDKPAPDTMELALLELNLPPKENVLWYVGDTDTDMEFAANAGAQKVFISHGFGSIEQAERYQPDLTVSNLSELLKQLDRINILR